MQIMLRKIYFNRLLLILIMLSVYALLLYLYKVDISPSNSYLGFVYKQLDLVELIVSILFFIIPAMILPLYPRRPSDFTVWALYLFSYAPTAFLSVHILNRGIVDVSSLLLMLLAAFFLFFYSRSHIFTILPKIKINFEKLDIFLLFLLFIIIPFYVWSLAGYKTDLDILTIYERRLAARETIVSSSIGAYTLSFSRQCMLLIGVYLGVAKKRPFYLFIVALLAIGLFSIDGTKTSIIIPSVLGMLSVFLIINPKSSFIFLPISLLFVCVVGLTEFLFNHSQLVNDYLVRRISIVPGLLNSFYWDFFSQHPKGMLTDSILRYFLEPLYDAPLTYVIGREYLHNIQANANAGIWMGWYAHFGIAGVFAASVIGGFIVGLIDKLAKSGLYILGCLVCFLIGVTWSEQMLHTSMLTGGIVIFIIMLLLINVSSKLHEFFAYPDNRNMQINEIKFGTHNITIKTDG